MCRPYGVFKPAAKTIPLGGLCVSLVLAGLGLRK